MHTIEALPHFFVSMCIVPAKYKYFAFDVLRFQNTILENIWQKPIMIKRNAQNLLIAQEQMVMTNLYNSFNDCTLRCILNHYAP